MTSERGSLAESKNCEILLIPTADRRFDTKVKCPTGRASFWVKFSTVRSLTRVKCPGIARGGGGMGSFGIDWYIMTSAVPFYRDHKPEFWLDLTSEEGWMYIKECLSGVFGAMAYYWHTYWVFFMPAHYKLWNNSLVNVQASQKNQEFEDCSQPNETVPPQW